MNNQIKIAVFPVAGFGTRFLPATKASPKEMLPVVDKPLIQYAVEEAYEAGIRQMVFVTGRNKWSITEHFDVAYELETELKARDKNAFLDIVHAVTPSDMESVFIRQNHALGLGHAVYCAEPVVGESPFAVILADDLVVNDGMGAIKQMVDAYERSPKAYLAVQSVPENETHKYGIITEGARVSDRISAVMDIVEKPEQGTAPSNKAVIGRYILPGEIMEILSRTPKGKGGEIQLTDAISELVKEDKVNAYQFEGKRYDCGSKLGYLQANVEVGMAHDELGANFRAYLSDLVRSQN